MQSAVGTTSNQLQGRVSPDDTERWTLRAKKAQTMRLSLVDHDNAGIAFTVHRPRVQMKKRFGSSVRHGRGDQLQMMGDVHCGV